MFVEQKVYGEFSERVAEYGKKLKVGNSGDPETEIGPLVSVEQLERVTGYLSIGRQEGARVLSGGQQLTEGELGKGYFVPRTVFADVKDDMRIVQEEIFGPVISAIPFKDVEEVIERANKTHFGLWQWRMDTRRRQGPQTRPRYPSRFGMDQLLSGKRSRRAI